MPPPEPDLSLVPANQTLLHKIQDYLRRELNDPSTSNLKRQLLSFILDIIPGTNQTMASQGNTHDRWVSNAQDTTAGAPYQAISSEYTTASINPPLDIGFTPSQLGYTPDRNSTSADSEDPPPVLEYTPPDLGFSVPSDYVPPSHEFMFLTDDADEDDD